MNNFFNSQHTDIIGEIFSYLNPITDGHNAKEFLTFYGGGEERAKEVIRIWHKKCPYKVIDSEDGTRITTLNGLQHSIDKFTPSEVSKSIVYFSKNGKITRDDNLPSIISFVDYTLDWVDGQECPTDEDEEIDIKDEFLNKRVYFTDGINKNSLFVREVYGNDISRYERKTRGKDLMIFFETYRKLFPDINRYVISTFEHFKKIRNGKQLIEIRKFCDNYLRSINASGTGNHLENEENKTEEKQ